MHNKSINPQKRLKFINNFKEKYFMARVLISMPEEFLSRIDQVA